jgi:signal transduction histidine kinase
MHWNVRDLSPELQRQLLLEVAIWTLLAGTGLLLSLHRFDLSTGEVVGAHLLGWLAGVLALTALNLRALAWRRRQQSVSTELRLTQQRMDLAASGGDLALWVWSRPDDRVTLSTPWLDALGLPPGATPTMADLRARIHPDDLAGALRAQAEHASGRSQLMESEFRLRKADGSWRWVLFRGRVVERDEAGTPLRAAGTMLDITRRHDAEAERGLLEQQLAQAQKIESIGRLSGGVAHDFNNLLTPILGFTQLCLANDSITPELRADLQQIHEASSRARDLVRQLLAFSRKQVLEIRALDLNVVIQQFEKMLRRLIGEDVEISLELAQGLGSIRADRTQLEQIIMNLAVNARDAMPLGGRIRIATSEHQVSDEEARVNPGMSAGRMVVLTVQDTGVGMTTEVLARVFEPFYTTKERGHGTGLGLATVYGAVKQHGGYIGVESELGRGSTFRLYFPRVDQAPDAQRPSVGGTLAGGHETILVVEDDGSVRGFVETVLRGLGYQVLVASSVEGALDLEKAHTGPIHLILADVIMPQATGKEAVALLSQRRPGIRSMYISGYSDEIIAPHGVLDPGVHFLQKPFTPAALAKKVREALTS